ncbi:MAG: glycosyltransferase family 2 protein [Clostridia bacterium]|nr:glycosyltransferase family 2 protein [Clostridia bacterium]
MDNPLVSVVIPVYGVEAYLDRCMESVTTQTYSKLEIILVDDGSPDNCPAMCDAWAQKDNRIKVIHKQNGGLTSARKAGFEQATGEYIIFFDSDDYVETNIIEKLLQAVLKTGKDMALCSVCKHNGDKVSPVKMNVKRDIIEPDELRDLFILPIMWHLKTDSAINGFMWTKFFKYATIKESFFVSEKEYYTEDVLFNIQLAKEINGIAIVDEPLCHYCVHAQSLTNQYRANKFEMWNKRADYFEEYLRENGWEAYGKERMINLNVSALLVGADNEVILNEKTDFVKKCKCFRQHIKEKGFLKLSNLPYVGNSLKIVLLMFYFRLYRVLFFYRKKRVGV